MKSQDRVAIITGAARGIGAAIAKNFAERAYSVLLVDANAEVTETASSLGPHAQAFVADVSSTDSVIEAVRNCADRFGSVDILVNNAGISPKPNGVKTPVEAMDRADWDRVMAINLTGAFMFCKAVIPFMRERGWGRIINISS
ncbi:MAG: SDR family NAD(P)-dependent oxidoreductase, partial [Planctomycetaceae bacterium]|nr:SDR family NAD(P)-dependent oxidoreductase [Planctomycetaceae bacterium]